MLEKKLNLESSLPAEIGVILPIYREEQKPKTRPKLICPGVKNSHFSFPGKKDYSSFELPERAPYPYDDFYRKPYEMPERDWRDSCVLQLRPITLI